MSRTLKVGLIVGLSIFVLAACVDEGSPRSRGEGGNLGEFVSGAGTAYTQQVIRSVREENVCYEIMRGNAQTTMLGVVSCPDVERIPWKTEVRVTGTNSHGIISGTRLLYIETIDEGISAGFVDGATYIFAVDVVEFVDEIKQE